MDNVVPFPPKASSSRTPGRAGGDSERSSEDQCSEQRLRTVVGDVLRRERHDQQRTLADVAERAAVSLPYLSEVERGRKDVSSEVLHAICDALELPMHDLLERSAERFRVEAGSQGASRFQLLAA